MQKKAHFSLCAKHTQLKSFSHTKIWFSIGTVLMITALTVALIKPYQKSYMNYLDALLLSNICILLFSIESRNLCADGHKTTLFLSNFYIY